MVERVEKIWDLPTRVLKWLLALGVVVGWFLGSNMSFDTIDLHIYVGYAVAAILVLRLAWGFIGARASRHSTMLRDALSAPSYTRKLFQTQPSYWRGHNPLGVLSIYALWVVMILQIATGLYAYNDSFFSGGPLANTVDESTRTTASALHETLSDIMLVLVLLHIASIVFYAIWKRENLVWPMITGRKEIRHQD